jgi:acetyl esterase
MSIDPQVQMLLDAEAESELPPLHKISVSDARQRLCDDLAVTDDERIPLVKSEDRMIPIDDGNIRCRVYTPDGDGPFPIMVYLHGGGWMLGNIETHDALCRFITKLSDCIVVSVDYRLAPENKYPTPLLDSYVATVWAYDHAGSLNGDSSRLAIGGDSSGGNLAAAVCLMARDRKGPKIRYQVLIYPVTDYYLPGTQSYKDNAKGFSLEYDQMVYFWENYLNDDADIDCPYICPLRSNDLSGLPPAHILTAEYDPLRDEGALYAKKLREYGVDVKLDSHEGLIHGYVTLWHVIDGAMDSIYEISKGLKRKFYSPESSSGEPVHSLK